MGREGEDRVLKLPPEEERGLVERLKRRDASALGPLVSRYGEELYGRVLVPTLGSAEEARDLLKEVFLTAFDRIETFSWREGGLFQGSASSSGARAKRTPTTRPRPSASSTMLSTRARDSRWMEEKNAQGSG